MLLFRCVVVLLVCWSIGRLRLWVVVFVCIMLFGRFVVLLLCCVFCDACLTGLFFYCLFACVLACLIVCLLVDAFDCCVVV